MAHGLASMYCGCLNITLELWDRACLAKFWGFEKIFWKIGKCFRWGYFFFFFFKRKEKKKRKVLFNFVEYSTKENRLVNWQVFLKSKKLRDRCSQKIKYNKTKSHKLFGHNGGWSMGGSHHQGLWGVELARQIRRLPRDCETNQQLSQIHNGCYIDLAASAMS